MKRLVALLAIMLGACGGSSAEDEVSAAVDDWWEALRDEDAETFCDKTFPSTVLPSRVADRLTFDPPADTGGSPARWDEQKRACREQFGRAGEFEAARRELSVVDVKLLEPFEETAGITAVANARVREGSKPCRWSTSTATGRSSSQSVEHRPRRTRCGRRNGWPPGSCRSAAGIAISYTRGRSRSSPRRTEARAVVQLVQDEPDRWFGWKPVSRLRP